jgi:hypothetical protein
MLLQKLKLCRADMVQAIARAANAPDAGTLRELADLQLVIMATEHAIADKKDPAFLRQFHHLEAAA